MKRKSFMFAAVFSICAILMSACQAANTGATNGTNPSQNTTVPIVTSTAAVRIPMQTTVPATTATSTETTVIQVTQPIISPETAELHLFNAMFMSDLYPERNSYFKATGCAYSVPTEIKLRAFLDGGFPVEPDVTDAEKEELGKLGLAPESFRYGDTYRLPKDRINAELSKVFGITLAELPNSAFEGLYYLESTDCYYLIQSGMTSVPMHSQIQTVEHNTDGTVTLTYLLPGGSGAITLKPNDDAWLVVSNTQNMLYG